MVHTVVRHIIEHSPSSQFDGCISISVFWFDCEFSLLHLRDTSVIYLYSHYFFSHFWQTLVIFVLGYS